MKKIILCLLILLIMPIKVHALEGSMLEDSKNTILLEASTGEILYEKDSHEKKAPASMTKMMSLVLLMEEIDAGNIKWDEKITVSDYAASMGGSQIYLKPKEEMTVTDLVKGVTMASANDAIVALAERVAGSEAKFVERMNNKLKELGLTDSNFKNATGLDEANHYSSAYDMAMIAKELVKHNKILEYSSIYEDYIRTDTPNKFWLVNTNKVVC